MHKVFLLSDGRINVCGLNTKNVEYVAKAIDDSVRNIQSHLWFFDLLVQYIHYKYTIVISFNLL